MKMIRPRNFIVFALAALSGTVLMHTSQRVQQAEMRMRDLNASIAAEQENIRLLRAEWESLNRPERLEKMAREFLDLVPPAPEHIVETPEALFENEGAGAGLVVPAALMPPETKSGETAEAKFQQKPQKESGPSAENPEKGFNDLIKDLEGGR